MRRGLLLTIPMLLVMLMVPAFFAYAQETEGQGNIRIYVDFPGSGSHACPEPNETKICVDSIGQYINAFYKYFAGAIGILATVMVMWGGFKWMTAAGNASRVSDARDTIYSAIIALILTFGSYILLNTINPRLVDLSVAVNPINGIGLGVQPCRTYLAGQVEHPTDCPGGECCGQTGIVRISETRSESCVWTSCNNSQDICVHPFDNPGLDYQCENIYEYCENGAPSGASTAEWCTTVDQAIASSLTADRRPRIEELGCGFNDIPTGRDRCMLSTLLSAYIDSTNPDVSDLPPEYEQQFFDCFILEAQGKCWENDDGQPVAKDCGGNNYCRSPNSTTDGYFGTFPQAVVGSDGACVRRLTGEYECWTRYIAEPIP